MKLCIRNNNKTTFNSNNRVLCYTNTHGNTEDDYLNDIDIFFILKEGIDCGCKSPSCNMEYVKIYSPRLNKKLYIVNDHISY